MCRTWSGCAGGPRWKAEDVQSGGTVLFVLFLIFYLKMGTLGQSGNIEYQQKHELTPSSTYYCRF